MEGVGENMDVTESSAGHPGEGTNVALSPRMALTQGPRDVLGGEHFSQPGTLVTYSGPHWLRISS